MWGCAESTCFAATAKIAAYFERCFASSARRSASVSSSESSSLSAADPRKSASMSFIMRFLSRSRARMVFRAAFIASLCALLMAASSPIGASCSLTNISAAMDCIFSSSFLISDCTCASSRRSSYSSRADSSIRPSRAVCPRYSDWIFTAASSEAPSSPCAAPAACSLPSSSSSSDAAFKRSPRLVPSSSPIIAAIRACVSASSASSLAFSSASAFCRARYSASCSARNAAAAAVPARSRSSFRCRRFFFSDGSIRSSISSS